MRFVVVGPVYPYRGGIAHYTSLLAATLSQTHTINVQSFKRQYPTWLYPGSSDKDPSGQGLRVSASYLLDPLAPWTWRAVLHEITAFAPDAVICQWWTTAWAPCFGYLINRLNKKGLHTVCICHNVLPHESKPWDKLLAKFVLGQASDLIVHSRRDAEAAAYFCRDRAKIHFHPLPTYQQLMPGQLPDKEAAKTTLGIDSSKVLLFFGLVRLYKGLRYLVEAMPQAFPARDGHLIVAGEFWEPLEDYSKLAETLGVAGNITWLPKYIPNEELSNLFAACDAVVLPYTSASQSAVVQLAFGAGKPVITTNVGGLPDVVDEGQTGLIVPPANSQALAAAIRRLYAEPGLLPQMTAAVSRGSTRFSWQSMVTLIEVVSAR